VEYSDFIKNKSVAIVGPAQYMMGKKLGEEIDKHDIVVRINRSIESCSQFGIDIGKKTDILYSCMIEKPENAGEIDIEDLINRNIHFVCIPPRSSMRGIASSPIQISEYASHDKLKDVKEKINTRIIDLELNNDIAMQVNCRPNTGYLAIFDLLASKPKKLSIYGFSFYLDGFIKDTKQGITGMSEKDYALKCFNSKRHVQSNLWSYAKKTLVNNKNVYLDKTLEKILMMEFFSKEIFENTINNID
tara:strand:- start:2242 stop:2979 length:738 start_codon:yes stop_codon:yes gene_type:complete